MDIWIWKECYQPKCLSQNLVFSPSLTEKEPSYNTSSLIFMRPLKKWESYGLALTWERDFELRYLFVSNFCQIPSVLSKLTIHLANKHLFCKCKSKIPSPPWSLSQHKISHLASRYLCLSEDPCQKNLDRKWSRFFKTPFGISKKEVQPTALRRWGPQARGRNHMETGLFAGTKSVAWIWIIIGSAWRKYRLHTQKLMLNCMRWRAPTTSHIN
jgi:hypothetical protein